MKFFFIIIFLCSIHANAYCITNNTDQTLYFMTESYDNTSKPIISFNQYIKAHTTVCCNVDNGKCNPSKKADSKLSFYVFTNKNSIEGCDIFGTSDSNIILNVYQDFDNCFWSKEK